MDSGVGCSGNELTALSRCGDEWLVHHNVESAGYSRCCKIEVRERRSAEDDEVKVRGQGKEGLRCGNDPGIRVAQSRFSGPRRIRRHDGVEGVAGISLDQRCVEDPSGDPETDDGGPDGCRLNLRHYSTSDRKRRRRSLRGLSKISAGVPASTTSPSSMKTT
ncbi:hypothetical protein D9M72_394910 [compost metagenome]